MTACPVNVEVKVTKPDDVEVSLTLRMTLGTLRKLREQLAETPHSSHYPACDLLPALRAAERAADHVVQLRPPSHAPTEIAG